jgi:hypothetical protein
MQLQNAPLTTKPRRMLLLDEAVAPGIADLRFPKALSELLCRFECLIYGRLVAVNKIAEQFE